MAVISPTWALYKEARARWLLLLGEVAKSSLPALLGLEDRQFFHSGEDLQHLARFIVGIDPFFFYSHQRALAEDYVGLVGVGAPGLLCLYLRPERMVALGLDTAVLDECARLYTACLLSSDKLRAERAGLNGAHSATQEPFYVLWDLFAAWSYPDELRARVELYTDAFIGALQLDAPELLGLYLDPAYLFSIGAPLERFYSARASVDDYARLRLDRRALGASLGAGFFFDLRRGGFTPFDGLGGFWAALTGAASSLLANFIQAVRYVDCPLCVVFSLDKGVFFDAHKLFIYLGKLALGPAYIELARLGLVELFGLISAMFHRDFIGVYSELARLGLLDYLSFFLFLSRWDLLAVWGEIRHYDALQLVHLFSALRYPLHLTPPTALNWLYHLGASHLLPTDYLALRRLSVSDHLSGKQRKKIFEVKDDVQTPANFTGGALAPHLSKDGVSPVPVFLAAPTPESCVTGLTPISRGCHNARLSSTFDHTLAGAGWAPSFSQNRMFSTRLLSGVDLARPARNSVAEADPLNFLGAPTSMGPAPWLIVTDLFDWFNGWVDLAMQANAPAYKL